MLVAFLVNLMPIKLQLFYDAIFEIRVHINVLHFTFKLQDTHVCN